MEEIKVLLSGNKVIDVDLALSIIKNTFTKSEAEELYYWYWYEYGNYFKDFRGVIRGSECTLGDFFKKEMKLKHPKLLKNSGISKLPIFKD